MALPEYRVRQMATRAAQAAEERRVAIVRARLEAEHRYWTDAEYHARVRTVSRMLESSTVASSLDPQKLLELALEAVVAVDFVDQETRLARGW